MSQEPLTPLEDLIEEVYTQVRPHTPYAVVEAIAVQIGQAREARGRVESEGSVVRDMKGSVIPHPALKVEIDAIKVYTALLQRHGVG